MEIKESRAGEPPSTDSTREAKGMKARPILFSCLMIRAIIDNGKTQTRRMMKPQPNSAPIRNLDGFWYQGVQMGKAERIKCPYGQPGDLLWVRETWACYRQTSYEYDEWEQVFTSAEREEWRGVLSPVYQADQESFPDRWNPSIHMPRWASRMTLELTEVRVERLQAISEHDGIAEGATSRPNCTGFNSNEPGWSMDWSNVGTPPRWDTNGLLTERDVCLGSARSAFGAFINQLHGGPRWNLNSELTLWDQNPWVWVLAFRVHKQNIDAFLKERAVG